MNQSVESTCEVMEAISLLLLVFLFFFSMEEAILLEMMQ